MDQNNTYTTTANGNHLGHTASSLNINVVGPLFVGKTSIVLRLLCNKFYNDYDPTIEDSYKKQIYLDGEYSTVHLLDTAGIEYFANLRTQTLRYGDAFMLVFSLSSMDSFNQLDDFMNQIVTANNDEQPKSIILLGNKFDLQDSRQISKEEVYRFLTRWDIPTSCYYECSAKLAINVQPAFNHVIRLARVAKKEKLNKLFSSKKPSSSNRLVKAISSISSTILKANLPTKTTTTTNTNNYKPSSTSCRNTTKSNSKCCIVM